MPTKILRLPDLPTLGPLLSPFLAAIVGSGLLVLLYLGIVTWAQGWGHARELIWDDRYFVGAIALGFGVQIGLYTHLRLLRRQLHLAAPTAATAAGTGTSSVAMVACCAHHLTEALPLIGLSGLAIFLNDYRIPLIALGLAVNAVGIAVMLRLLIMQRRQAAASLAAVTERGISQ